MDVNENLTGDDIDDTESEETSEDDTEEDLTIEEEVEELATVLEEYANLFETLPDDTIISIKQSSPSLKESIKKILKRIDSTMTSKTQQHTRVSSYDYGHKTPHAS